MVSPDEHPTDSKRTCTYDLQAVHRLIRANASIHFTGTQISVDLDEMGWDENDLVSALLSLTPSHFDVSHMYKGLKSWSDVYTMKHTGANGLCFDLYIKFRLPFNGQSILVCSFHKTRRK